LSQKTKAEGSKDFLVYYQLIFDLIPPKKCPGLDRRRWDIEGLFFRFIKKELNVTTLVSLNKNGIEVDVIY